MAPSAAIDRDPEHDVAAERHDGEPDTRVVGDPRKEGERRRACSCTARPGCPAGSAGRPGQVAESDGRLSASDQRGWLARNRISARSSSHTQAKPRAAEQATAVKHELTEPPGQVLGLAGIARPGPPLGRRGRRLLASDP